MVIFKFFFAKPISYGYYFFFATGENKIIAYDISTGPSICSSKRDFSLACFYSKRLPLYLLISFLFIESL